MAIEHPTSSHQKIWKILNCPQVARCTQRWDDLQPVADNPKLRHCSACNKDVHHCESEKDLLEHRALGHCIAIKVELIDGRVTTWVGGLVPPYS